MTLYYYLVVAGFGLIFGSFFNVVIYRTPKRMGLGDRSMCPACGGVIRWYDNVPLLSYLLLRGRCRGCRETISIRYPLIEGLASGLFVLVYWWSRNVVPGQLGVEPPRVASPELFIGLLLVSVVLIASATDITSGIVPNNVTYPALVMMLLLVTGTAVYRGQPGRITIAVATGFAGAAFLLAAGLIYGAVFMRPPAPGPVGAVASTPRGESPPREEDGEDEKGEQDDRCQDGPPKATGGESEQGWEDEGISTGLGMGDVKFVVFTGLALGFFHWYLLPVQLFIAPLAGVLVAVPMIVISRWRRKTRIPFVPFLSAGAVIALIWGNQIVDVYWKLSS